MKICSASQQHGNSSVRQRKRLSKNNLIYFPLFITEYFRVVADIEIFACTRSSFKSLKELSFCLISFVSCLYVIADHVKHRCRSLLDTFQKSLLIKILSPRSACWFLVVMVSHLQEQGIRESLFNNPLNIVQTHTFFEKLC